MAWINDFTVYEYTSSFLRKIAISYDHIRQGIVTYTWVEGDTSYERRIMNPWEIAEYEADFENALSAIGRGYWNGVTGLKTSDYRDFGRLQKVVIADILLPGELHGHNISSSLADSELEGLGFYRIPQVRGYAYHLMSSRLNGKPHYGANTQFVSKRKTGVV